MTFANTIVRGAMFSAARHCLTPFLSILILTVTTCAQTSSITAGRTPPGMAPGSPAGSYALSGFENVNLFSGKLNFHLPLVQVGGRGQAGYTIPLKIEQHWNINRDCSGCAVYGPQDYPTDYWWNGIDPGYTPGAMIARGISEAPSSGLFCNANETLMWRTLTRLTFIMPDGTEYELVDYLTGGAPHTVTYPCSGAPSPPEQGVSRGRVFVTHDGSAATFISDTTIYDANYNQNDSGTQFHPTGYLLLKDGTRHRIVQGQVQWTRDRNGNRVSFTYNSGGLLTQIEDSLGRHVTFGSGGTTCGANSSCSWIVYSGFGGAARTIKIWGANLGDTFDGTRVLRDDYSLPLKTGNQLFPELKNPLSVVYGPYNPWRIAVVELPDGRRYKFQYNYYGELARVVLPTGGAFEYDWEGAAGNGESIFDWGNAYGAMVYRRVKARRVFKDATTLEGETTYAVSPISTINGAPNGQILVDHKDPAGNALSHEEHYFHGTPLDNTGSPYDYPAWNAGLERQTDYFKANPNTNPTTYTLLQRTAQSWQQGPRPSSWTGGAGNNPRLVETLMTLATATPGVYRVAKQSAINPLNNSVGFDQYNNQTDLYEYDFGPGQPGALKRHTHTDFLTTNDVNGAAYDTINPSTTDPNANATIHLRDAPLRRWVSTDPDLNSGMKKALTSFEYDNYAFDATHADLVDRSSISGLCTTYNAAGQCSSLNSADYKTRGNVTSIINNLLSTGGVLTGSVTSYSQFDVVGNVVKVVDARGNFSTILYEDNYGSPDVVTMTNTQPPELAQAGNLASYAFPTLVTDSKGHVTHIQYDYYLGATVKTQDPNGVMSSISYNDPLDRPKQSIRALDTAQISQTTITYQDSARTVTATSDLNTFNDNLLKVETVYDGLGRTAESRTYESTTAFIRTKQTYDALGRVASVSNPYRTTADPTYGAVMTAYDALGRVQTVTTSDGSYVQTDYDGTKVLVTDQAGRKRVSDTNALGQLTDVWEIKPADSATVAIQFGGQNLNGYLTHYDYDALSNLRQVTQGTQTPRSFTYDSLSRLTSSTNPEGGMVQYQYDANGNMVLKIDPRPRFGNLDLSTCSIPYEGDRVATCTEYDSLNRVKTRTYNDGTPNVTYVYDTAPNGKGRLASVSSSVSTYTYTGYDVLGRVKSSSQTTDGVTYTMPDYQYDLADNLTSEQYPSGRVVKTNYDVAGRVAGVKNQATGIYYAGAATGSADNIQYAASGAASAVKLGNTLWERTDFNSRLQPTQIRLGTVADASSVLRLNYTYGADDSHNNGSLRTQTITLPGMTQSYVQTYGYDEMNRLTSAVEMNSQISTTTPTWKQLFSYDRYGNRNFAAGTTSPDYSQTPNDSATGLPVDPVRNPVFDPSNNRIKVTTAGQSAYSYDEAGNLKCDPQHQCGSGNAHEAYFDYDAENRMVRAGAGGTGYDNGGASYAYDSDGRRVKKAVSNGEMTVFVYDAMGKVVAEYSNQVQSNGTRYVTFDTLGSTRVVTDAQGLAHSQNGAKGSRHDYLPFGEEIGISSVTNSGRESIAGYNLGNIRQQFTGYARDDETGLDYAQARYYASAQGRFTGADRLIASAIPVQPQSWNRYAYCLNNPLAYIDPSGLKWAVQYNNGTATFQWYEGSSIPTGPGWEGLWEPYDHEWFIGSDEAVWLDPNSSNHRKVQREGYFTDFEWTNLRETNRFLIANPKIGEKLSRTGLFNEDIERLNRAVVERIKNEHRQFLKFLDDVGMVVDAVEAARIPGFIYRQGRANPGNLVPGADGTVSFRDSLSNPYPQRPGEGPVFNFGKDYFCVDTSKLPPGSVIPDNIPPGHVGVTGVTPSQIKDAVIGVNTLGKLPKEP